VPAVTSGHQQRTTTLCEAQVGIVPTPATNGANVRTSGTKRAMITVRPPKRS
jgi:hypothetical protein